MTFRTELDGLKTGLQTAIGKRVKLSDLNLTTPEEILDRTKHTGVQAIATVDGLETRLTAIEQSVSAVDQIDDLQTTGDKTWSSSAIRTELDKVATDATNANAAMIDDLSTSAQKTWSSSAIQTELNKKAVVNDAAASETQVFSSSKVNAEILQVTNALATLTSTVDSINTTLQLEVGEANIAINDVTTSLVETWSSEKINSTFITVNQKIDAVVNDTVTATTSTLSSQKITEIKDALQLAIDAKPSLTTQDQSNTEAWSASKSFSSLQAVVDIVNDQISNVMTQVAQKTSLNDSELSNEKTWSSQKINNTIESFAGGLVADVVNDETVSVGSTWSSQNIQNKLDTKTSINDASVDSATETYSVQKLVATFSGINTVLQGIQTTQLNIDDVTPATNKVYSSDKVEALLTAMNAQIAELRTDLNAAIAELRALVEAM